MSRAWSKALRHVVEDPNQKEPWEQRKQEYLPRLRSEPADVQLISAADKLYNARTILDEYRNIGSEVWKRFKRGRDLQIWYFRELRSPSSKSSGTNRIVEELDAGGCRAETHLRRRVQNPGSASARIRTR